MSSKVWFITGCSSGIGHSIATEALSRGDKVIATARNITKLEALEGAGATVLEWDVSLPLAQLQKKAHEAYDKYGQIDYLINNAGYSLVGTFEEVTPEETQTQFDTNVFGLLNTTRALLPFLRRQRSGVIANLSSIGGWGGFPAAGVYCTSKWAVSGISESMAPELADFGIKVCCIEPGYFRSNFLNPGNRKEIGPRRIPEYEGTQSDKMAKMLEAYDNNQPGDPKKAAKAIYNVLSQQDGREIPLRLALGTDAYQFIKKKCEDTLAILEEWKDVTLSTDITETTN